MRVRIGPNAGPQTKAYASSATITIYGGAAGGGKSWLTLFRFGIHARRYTGYFGVIFRRTMPQVLSGGGLWEESMGLYPVLGARANHGMHQWRFSESRSLVQMRGLQHAADVVDYQGSQFAEVGFEELTHFDESQFWYMISRLRTTCGMKARVLATCNPDPDSWVRKLIDWWICPTTGLAVPERAGAKRYFVRDGDALVWGESAEQIRDENPHLSARAPQSLRFIPAMLSDNPQGDPDYRSKLEALPLVQREQLLGGNWNVRATSGSYFRRSYFEVIDHVAGRVVRRVRGWDLAATEASKDAPDPDWTVGVLVAQLDTGRWLIEHVERMRGSPGKVEEAMRRIAQQDGPGVLQAFWQDPAQAGKSQASHVAVRVLAGFRASFRVASRDKQTYAGPVSSLAEHGGIAIKRGAWNDAFFSVLEGFPTAKHDDDVDALSRAAIELLPGEAQLTPGVDDSIPRMRM